MIRQIKKRDGRIESFDQEKIKNAIWKAAKAVGGTNEAIAEDLSDQVVEMVSARFTDPPRRTSIIGKSAGPPARSTP